MSSRTVFLAKLIGLSLIGFSLAMLTHKTAGVATMTALIHQSTFVFIFGSVALVAGLAVVLSHNRWSGGVLPVVITLLGWVILIRGLLLLFLPESLIVVVFEKVRFADYFALYVGGVLLVGLGLTGAGLRVSAGPPATLPRG